MAIHENLREQLATAAARIEEVEADATALVYRAAGLAADNENLREALAEARSRIAQMEAASA